MLASLQSSILHGRQISIFQQGIKSALLSSCSASQQNSKALCQSNLIQASFFATKKATQKPKTKTAPKKSDSKPISAKGKETKKPQAKDKEKEIIIAKEKKEADREKVKSKVEKEKATKQKERQKEKDKKVKQKTVELKEKEKEKKKKEIEEKEAKPKKARTSFSVYFSDQFASVRKQNPKLKISEITKILAQKWKALSDADRKPFVAKSEEDKKRHKKEMDEYKKTLPPKRPLSGYLIFSNEKRNALVQAKPGSSMADIAKVLGQEWKKLAETKREAYNKTAGKALAEWKQKVEQFKS